MDQVILQLFAIFGPTVAAIIQRLMARNGGKMPTYDEMVTEFMGNTDKYLAEGAKWKASHPR